MVVPLTPCGRGIEIRLLEYQVVTSLKVPGTFLRCMQRGGPVGPQRDTGAPLPLSRARTRPGGPLVWQRAGRMAPLRWGTRDSPGGGLGGRRQRTRVRCGQQAASQGGIYLDTEETAGSPIKAVRQTDRAKGLLGSGRGVLKTRWTVGSPPPFQLRCRTPAGKMISEPGPQSYWLPSISMLIVPRRM